MRTPKFLLGIGICFWAAVVIGQESISQFSQRMLTLDLATVPFGAKASEHPEFNKYENQLGPSGTSTNIIWYGGKGAEMYATNFPDRNVSYGFADGRLVCIRLGLSAMELTSINTSASEAEKQRITREATEKAKPKQDALNKLRNEIRLIAKAHGATRPSGECLEFEDSALGPFKFRYCSFCSPEENLFCNITITQAP